MACTLYYAHDPMCSWCWAFRPTWDHVQQNLPGEVRLTQLLGGLAPDSNQSMPAAQREMLQDIWHNIASRVPGTRFNFDFWRKCQPRRSTYPACRAVIAAARQEVSKQEPMTVAIQRAYYLEARNPSNEDTLIELAREINLDIELFTVQLNAEETQQELLRQVRFCSQLGIAGFPSLVMHSNNIGRRIPIEFNDPQLQINLILDAAGLAA